MNLQQGELLDFARVRTIEGGVRLECDLESARLLAELVDAASVTDHVYKNLRLVAKALKLNLGMTS